MAFEAESGRGKASSRCAEEGLVAVVGGGGAERHIVRRDSFVSGYVSPPGAWLGPP